MESKEEMWGENTGKKWLSGRKLKGMCDSPLFS